ncbi:RHS repeat-associated core domain-containing protein [Lysobacter sp. FW306-1B-D06B]|uniref:RHS repeat-associated core domain-containing protein n=1 Tax=Lysobacter sp. FW306-1B-D06B TaxID=3140250 RepID=UPI003140B81F
MMPPRWMQTPARGRERTMEGKEGMLTNLGRKLLATLVLFVATFSAHAQTQFPLGSNGWMGLGNRNGDFFIEQDDLSVKVPGGYVRINRDYDGKQWVFNRQWSGLGRPSYNKAMYPSMGAFFSCTVVDGVSSCDNTASSGSAIAIGNPENEVQQTRIPNDPFFGRDLEGRPVPDPHAAEFVARNGVGFSRSTDGTSWVSSKHPRFVVRPQSVPVLPASNGADAHPAPGKPGAGGTPTTLVNGFRWIDRSGSWIEYDNIGRITSYGDRNNVRVWFQYGSHGQVERILDDNGRTVFTLLYSNGSADFITEVRDHTPLDGSIRRVKYQYDGDGRLRNVVDARGNTTSFDYGSLDSPAYDYNGSFGAPDSGGSGAPIGARASSAAMLLVDTRRKVTKVTDAEGRVTEIGYGVTARVGRVKAPDGGLTEFDYGYDKLKKEFSITVRYPQTEGGRKIETFRFDQEGRPVTREANGKALMTSTGSGRSITYIDERNGSTQIQRDNFDEVTRIAYADGTSKSYAYEAGSTDVREFTDEAGTIWRNRWDGRGNLLDVKAAAGRPEEQVTEYVYNARGEAELIRRKGGSNPDGSTDVDTEVRMTRDDNGNVSEVLDGEGKRWTYEYDSQGNLTKATNPLNHQWAYTYDVHGNLLTETDPNQHTVTYTYDRTDLPLTITDARGKITRIGYDAAGRESSIANHYGETYSDRFDVAGRLSASSDPIGQTAGFSYDAFGRLTKLKDGENYETLLDYVEGDGADRGGRQPGKITYPTFQRLFRYDDRKRPSLQTEVLPDDSLTIGWTYDAVGRVRTQTDPNGHTRSFEYDGLGRMVSAISEIGATVKFGYDHRNNLVSFTNPRQKVTRMAYDGRGLLVSETNALDQTTRYVYDDAGNLVEMHRPNGVTVKYQHDAAQRLEQSQAFGTDGSLQGAHSYQWDAAGNLSGWTTGRASSVLEYDDADRLLGETVQVDGVSLSRRYTYYANDQVKTYTGPDGITLTYSYDKNDQLSRVEIPGEGSISVTEWSWLAPKKVVLPGGTVQEMERDGLLGLTRLRVKSPSQATLFELENRFGKLRELGSRETDGKITQFEYDEAVRLVKTDAQFIGGGSETYVIDKAGNREQQSTISGTWEYDDANRLQRRGDVSYDYDSAGNLIRKVEARLSEPFRTTRYVYDGFNRLVEVRDGANALVATYAYDPFDNRLAKEVFVDRAGSIPGKTLFLQAEEGLLAEVAADGSVIRGYGWDPSGTYSTYPLFQRADGNYYYYHNDHLGTPWRVTNREGGIVWSANDYTAFGTAKIAAGAQITQPWRFPGQYFDAETSLHYNQRRYYEAEVGRYITEDPIGFDGGPNFYAYTGHSPTNRIDPTGEAFMLVPIGWNAARAAAGRYATCLVECAVVDGVSDLINNPCDIDVTDCLKDCLWSLVPIPCKKLAALWGGVQGLWNSLFNSFPGATEVATPGGLRRIEDLRPGDKVLAYSEWAEETQVEEVTNLILSHHEQTIVTLWLSSGKQLEVTGGHPLHTPDGWRAAQLLLAGGQLDVKGPDGKLATVGILRVEQRKETVAVYNLEVADSHTFYVGEDGVLAHNVMCKGKGSRNPKVRDAAANGRQKHREFADKVKAKEGWQSEPQHLVDPKTGKKVVPDALDRSGRPIELKPNTPSGRRAGRQQLDAYERATGKRGRVVYY